MLPTVSATEARVRFGELLDRAEHGETIIVERGGEPSVIVLSVKEYERLRAASGPDAGREALERALETGLRLRERRGGIALTPSEDIIEQAREERDDELLGLR